MAHVRGTMYANQQAHARRWRGSRWSVTALCGTRSSPVSKQSRWPGAWWRRASGSSCYRFIYAQLARKPGVSTCPSASRNVGGGVVGEGTQPHSSLSGPLAERPQEANDRQTPGHWEADLAVQDLWTGRPDPPRAPLPPESLSAPGEIRPHRRL